MLNVHLVAHTHDDVGWLKTVDQYYYGSECEFLLFKMNLHEPHRIFFKNKSNMNFSNQI